MIQIAGQHPDRLCQHPDAGKNRRQSHGPLAADLLSGTRAFDRAVKRARERYEKTNSLCDESFLKDLRFHDLRHEATSRLAEIFPMHELTKITGHKDPRMLMRYYHPKAEDLALKLK
ncbi:tyrosine-type recombinase/integrase [Escherichia coli]|uniref:tyrosine-type recombinase/integrase n=1 Tax=Escherichia coli TaxID=562 RepID=UPI00399B9BB0